jgi:hypothetical protein
MLGFDTLSDASLSDLSGGVASARAAILEKQDATIIVAIVSSSGAVSILEGHDRITALGSMTATGHTVVIENSDRTATSVSLTSTGQLSIHEHSDVVVGLIASNAGMARIREAADQIAGMMFAYTPRAALVLTAESATLVVPIPTRDTGVVTLPL